MLLKIYLFCFSWLYDVPHWLYLYRWHTYFYFSKAFDLDFHKYILWRHSYFLCWLKIKWKSELHRNLEYSELIAVFLRQNWTIGKYPKECFRIILNSHTSNSREYSPRPKKGNVNEVPSLYHCMNCLV